MDRSNLLTLIKTTYTADDMGVQRPAETSRTIFCDVSSVTLSEWTEGGRIGLNPEYRFTAFLFDYDDEKICEFNGKRYAIYRTYIGRDDTIELYAERRQGDVNG